MQVALVLGDVDIIAVDAMQVYKGMDIGTAKPTLDDRRSVRHHCLDLVEPSERFTATQFQGAASTALDVIREAGRRLFGSIFSAAGGSSSASLEYIPAVSMSASSSARISGHSPGKTSSSMTAVR